MGNCMRLFMMFAFLVCLPLSAYAGQPSQTGQTGPQYRLVAGTELIADIVRDILPAQTEILVLVPAASCPGHHDMRAADMAFFSKADRVLLHGWQKNAPGIAEATQAANLPNDATNIVQTRGSFLVPENQIAASREIAAHLASLAGVDARILEKRLADRITRITALEGNLLALLAPYRDTPALSAEMQAEFVRWAGLKVVGEYGRAEDMSPGALMSLADAGKNAGVKVVVDNLQSGAEAGLPLARDLGAAHVGFSNFPGYTPETGEYESLLTLNVKLLLGALGAR